MKARSILYVIDTHTEGEPTRVVLAGLPRLEGATLAEKRAYMKENLDWLRTALLLEPRGHDNQFGAVVLPSAERNADYALIFMDTSGYLDMCCHATIGVTTALIETGVVEPEEPYTTIRYETVVGEVVTKAKIEDGSVAEVSLVDVPSFYFKEYYVKMHDKEVPVHVAYGGNFYVIVEAGALGVKVRLRNVNELVRKGIMLRDEASRQIPVHHPEFGSKEIKLTIITDEPELPQSNGKNVVIFGNGQFDRSPCGTGTAARLAVMYSMGLIKPGQLFVHESIINTTFKARILKTTKVGRYDAVVPEITGRAFITQMTNAVINRDDPLWRGFSVLKETQASRQN